MGFDCAQRIKSLGFLQFRTVQVLDTDAQAQVLSPPTDQSVGKSDAADPSMSHRKWRVLPSFLSPITPVHHVQEVKLWSFRKAL